MNDNTFATRWGGSQWRYKKFPGAVSRCRDPFGSQVVQFAKPIEHEAWIRWRFDWATIGITGGPTTVSATISGRPVAAEATFVVRSTTGCEQYHLVAKDAAPRRRLATLNRIAKARRAKVVVQLLPELRSDVALFWRLELLRQAAVIYRSEGAEYDMQILRCIDSGERTRWAVHAALHHLDSQLLDARLAQLHCLKLIQLHFDHDNFGISRVGGVQ
jgi:hypothetical protein